MKKVLSIVLAVAVLATMAFSMMAATASAATATSLLPASADDFVKTAMGPNGNEEITITADGTGYKFSAPAGWPCATYAPEDQSKWVSGNVNDAECYLNWDFTCTAGANIVVFFEGASPNEQGSAGTSESINYYIDPANGKNCDNAVKDLAAGTYKNSIAVKDLGVKEELIKEDGTIRISGIKVFAVGGDVTVRELSVGPKGGDVTPVTTNANSNTSSTTATVAKTTAKAGTDSAKTGDTTNAIVFIAVAAVAAGAVVVTAKKQKAR